MSILWGISNKDELELGVNNIKKMYGLELLNYSCFLVGNILKPHT